jgi:FkbM family methyltransferase
MLSVRNRTTPILRSNFVEDGVGPELRLLLRFTRRLPEMKGAVRVANFARKFYLRKKRHVVDADVLDFRMRLDPSDWMQGSLLFWPQLWDSREIRFIKQKVRKGDTFLDIGAHIGFTTLVASRLVGPDGLVLAVEAAPDLYHELCANLDRNNAKNVHAVNVAASDSRGIMNLSGTYEGNSAGRSVLSSIDGAPITDGTPVQCLPLADLVRERSLTRIAGVWLAIAGMDFRVLSQYFKDVTRELWPGFVIVLDDPGWWLPQTSVAYSNNNLRGLLHELGYREKDPSKNPSKNKKRVFTLGSQ